MSAKAIAVAVDEPVAAIPIGLPALCQMPFDGHDLAPVWNKLVQWVRARPNNAAALLDLSVIAHAGAVAG